MKRCAFLLSLWALACGVWSEAVAIGPGRHPSLVRDAQGRLYVAYENRGDIVLRSSDDAGQTWCDPREVCKTEAPSQAPCLQVESDGSLDVVWQEGKDICFSRSPQGIGPFSAPLNLSQAPGQAQEPALACGPEDALHVVWIDDRPNPKSPDVYYSYSLNRAQSWTVPANLSRTPGVCSRPSLGVSGDRMLHVAWLDTTSGETRPDVFAVHGSQDSFSRPENVSNTPGLSQSPQVVVTPRGRVYLVWADNSRTKQVWDIYGAHSDDGGLFTQPRFFDTPGDSLDPSLTAEGENRIALVWSDASDNRQAPDIFLAQSMDGATTHTLPKNISRTAGVSRFPKAAIVQDQIVVIWEELEKDSYALKVAREPVARKPGRPNVSGGKY